MLLYCRKACIDGLVVHYLHRMPHQSRAVACVPKLEMNLVVTQACTWLWNEQDVTKAFK